MNRFQRWYFGWAEKHYLRMTPELRGEAIRIDRFLYSRRGMRFWAGLALAVMATAAGLMAAGMTWQEAVVVSALSWIGLGTSLMGAWLKPEQFAPKRLLRTVLVAGLLGYLGALVGFVVGGADDHGWPDTTEWADLALRFHRGAVPIVMVVIGAMTLMMAAVAALRSWRSERELAALREQGVRDTAARQIAETQLRLLRAQIEPHFIFNTLATMQHWVDVGDARAGPLLRALTTFLRASTDLFGRETLRLADELPMLRDYLTIMGARLGERLSFTVEASEAALAQTLPPGIGLTLVENALEHGVCCALAGGHIDVQARTDDTDGSFVLTVSNNGETLAPGWHDGVGLANTRERLAHCFGPRARLTLGTEGECTVAELRIAPESPQPARKEPLA